MAWHSLNSTSQGSTVGLRGFLLRLNRYCCKTHPDLNVVHPVELLWFFTSKAPLKSLSQILLTAVVPSLLGSLLPSLVLHVPPRPWILSESLGHCPFSFALHQSAGRKGNIKACHFNAASVATCITSRQTLSCCHAADIN